MSFLVRQIALKASGGELERAKRVDGDEMKIGRDSSCGLHLPDLGVDPEHALVTQLDESHIEVESLNGQPFEVDGQSVQRKEIDVTLGSELKFGSHRIKVGLYESKFSGIRFPSFTVRRETPVSHSNSDPETNEAYTLKGLVPSKRMSAWAFAAMVLLAFLAWPIWSYASYSDLALKKNAERPAGYHADKSWESGKLSKAHASLENDCQACHVKPFVAVRDNACQTCHTKVHDHIKDTGRLIQARGAPGGFAAFQRAVATTFNKPAGRCVECHTEHEGAGDMAPTEQKFCTDCHAGLKTRLPDTRLPDAADFGTSHPQLMPTVVVDPSNAMNPMTKQIAWSPTAKEFSGVKFTHAQHLSTVNGVAQMVRRRPNEFPDQEGLNCENCHQSDPSGVWYKPVVMEEACQTCHSLTFDKVGGTFRTLRHGEPEQVVADLRGFFAAGAPPRPINLDSMSRRVPGDRAAAETASDYARAVRFYPTEAGQAINMLFNKGGACFDCHNITRNGSAATAGYNVQNVVQTQRYYHKGWFTHAKHTKFDCVDCHVKAKTSNDATDLLVPGLDGEGGCRTCHVGGTGAKLASSHVKQAVDSSCAMCHDYHLDEKAPWLTRLPASRRASYDRRRNGGAAASSSR
ncbi:cytochrome c3 family protein [Novosphingobium sp. Gsoil 351]|uniref:cytochrome c3 family protein n=1 Tax=Novosphingobium sp. Gsoil 351 TaxID=2675225 RepID=UPI0012B46AAC|nr:cytochrome c3 family protein [Novosphingobium sp. Gsoil 351]QGN54682.1 hypothetical protein GKE62_09095 [Novosphingobium sp. Gsoil 351]